MLFEIFCFLYDSVFFVPENFRTARIVLLKKNRPFGLFSAKKVFKVKKRKYFCSAERGNSGFSVFRHPNHFEPNHNRSSKRTTASALPQRTFAMLLQMFKSKIHRVKVTEANLNYVGSITIDEDLMEAANLLEGEKVQIVNNNNGERIETYVIRGERGSGIICLNGAAARRAEVGDIVIIISYAWLDAEEAKTFKPVAVFPDDNNRLV